MLMNDNRLPLSIQAAAEQTSLTVHTLRYYEQIGLFLLLPAGDATAGEPRALLETHRQKVIGQLQALQAALDLLDYKVQHYVDIEQKMERLLA